jgi:hypothetical protein
MNASIPQSRRSPPVWLSVVVWLSAFLSPTAYFLLMLLADRFHIARPPETVVCSLFYFIPVAGLLVCESVVWMSSKTVARRIVWMLLTLFAMLLQFGLILAIIFMAMGYVQ